LDLFFLSLRLALQHFFLLFKTVVLVFAGLSGGYQPATANMPHFYTYLMLSISVFYAALAIWRF
jgi:hypothetical protein